jgi:hypothetical protein
MNRRVLAFLLVVAMACPQFALARYKPKPGFNLFSVEQDVQLGREHAAEAEKQFPILNDEFLTRYIDRLGQRLAANAPGTKFPYTFKIVNMKEINAFALPGGPIYINLGTIQAADNEAELAGVIGHEIGHVVMRHGTNQATKAQGFQIVAALAGAKAGGGIGGQLAQLGLGFGLQSVFLKYGRDAERQADLVGSGLLHDSGLNPQGMVTFFEKLAAQSGGGRGAEFFSSHPNPGNRAQAVAKEVASLGRRSYQSDSADFREVKRRVGGMKALTAQEVQQGQGQGSGKSGPVTRSKEVFPSGNFKTYDQAAYSLSYPDNWTASGGQDGGVTIVPPAGVSGNNIAYGTIISGFQPSNTSDLAGATDQLVTQLLQQNAQLKVQGGGQDFRLNGRSARSTVLLGPSPIQNEQERDWLVTIQRDDGSVLYAIFIAPDADFKQLQPTFEKMLRSIKIK